MRDESDQSDEWGRTEPGKPPIALWQWVLICLGSAVLIALFVVWLIPTDKTTTNVSEGSTVTVTSTPGTTTTTTQTGAPSTSVTRSAKNTKTTASAKSRRTDTLFGVVFGAALALILVGAFGDRIQTIKAGGVELTLQAKVAQALASKVTPQTEEERQKVEVAYVMALKSLPSGTSPGDDPVIEAATRSALRSVGWGSTRTG
jgi:hypothetical protein